MIKNFNEAKNMQIMFLKYFQSSLSIELVILCLYVLFCSVFILKRSLKGIIFSVIGFVIMYLAYLLVYDVTYINYLMSLRLDESFRLLVSQYLPYFSLAKHAPSKALPKFNRSQLNIIKIIFDNSLIMKYYYKYLLMVQKRLLFIARIYIIILNIPESKKTLISKYTYIKDKIKFFYIIRFKSFKFSY